MICGLRHSPAALPQAMKRHMGATGMHVGKNKKKRRVSGDKNVFLNEWSPYSLKSISFLALLGHHQAITAFQSEANGIDFYFLLALLVTEY